MGWSGGSKLAEDLWSVIRKHLPARHRKKVANKIIDLFENQDADTMEEAEDLWSDSGRADFLEEEYE